MTKQIFILLSLFSIALCGIQATAAKNKPEILGIKLGMNAEEAHKQLKKIGELEKEERKQQEIWKLKDNASYSYLIVAFDPDQKRVRYITAKVHENGRRVRYSDVIDIKKARREAIGKNVKYTLNVPIKKKQPGYVITARGEDPEYLTYYSIEVTSFAEKDGNNKN